MLQEAHILLRNGIDVKLGYIETHGREDVKKKLIGLPVIPRRKIFYKSRELEEMDLQAIINLRPEVVIIDLIRKLLQELFGEQQTNRKEPLKIFADGKESYFEKEILNITLEPKSPQDKKLISHVILLRNITSYKELDFAKTNFIATVSHEFKTPISSIEMSLQLLENNKIGTLNDEQKNLLGSIKDDADREKTAWVLTNIISNAIRYSYDNSIIFLSIEKTGRLIQFLVKDTGQGIAPEYKNKIFERYFRAPGSKKEGTGLGLAISKEFIEAQGGKITVESDFGAGSTFIVALNKIF